MARPWSEPARRWVVAGALVLAGLALYRVRAVLPPFVLALLIAYVLNPVIHRLDATTPLGRTQSVILIYLLFVVLVVVVPVLFHVSDWCRSRALRLCGG